MLTSVTRLYGKKAQWSQMLPKNSQVNFSQKESENIKLAQRAINILWLLYDIIDKQYNSKFAPSGHTDANSISDEQKTSQCHFLVSSVLFLLRSLFCAVRLCYANANTKNGQHPPLFVYFRSFQTTKTIFTANKYEELYF